MVKQETIFDAGGSASQLVDEEQTIIMGDVVDEEQTIIMVGNPGMGKSTVLNQLCGAAVFQSGEGHHGFTIEELPFRSQPRFVNKPDS